MKVLVTGAAGFIGSHLTELLVNEGFEIKAFVRYNSKNSWGWLESSPVKNDIEIINGDIRDFDSVSHALKNCKAVFHLAALVGIPYSYISPNAYIQTNITGTYNILQVSKELGLEQVIITSTSEIYGTAQYVPMDEDHPMVGQSPYSATKIAADQIALSYHKSFGLPVKIARPFNTYGPRQSARAIVPTIISQIFSDKQSISAGKLTPTRDLTYVKDMCNGFLEIFKSEKLFGLITNIGMGQEISVYDLMKKILALTGIEKNVETDPDRIRPDHSEVERLMCNNKKLISNTGWKPLYDLDKGLSETIQWLKHNIHNYKPDIYNV